MKHSINELIARLETELCAAKGTRRTLEHIPHTMARIELEAVDAKLSFFSEITTLLKALEPKSVGECVDGERYLIKTDKDLTRVGTYFAINKGFTLDFDLEFLKGEIPVECTSLTAIQMLMEGK